MEDNFLSRYELELIDNLVRNDCANYDNEYGCLPLESECYMLGIAYRDTPFCKYFESSVLLGTDEFALFSNRDCSNEQSIV